MTIVHEAQPLSAARAIPAQPTPLTIARTLLDAMQLSQAAWEGEEDSVREEHVDLIENQAALLASTAAALEQMEISSGTNAEQLRRHAAHLLLQAEVMDGQRLFVAIHSHRFGESVYPLWAVEEPTEDQVVSILDDSFEPEREEFISVHGLCVTDLAGTVACGISAVTPAGDTQPGESDDDSECTGPRA